jgi:oligosaccharyltransferase complex subunit delta (ribophorin II)
MIFLAANAATSQTQKDLPIQFLGASHPLDASIIIGSFGSSNAYRGPAFNLVIDRDPTLPLPSFDIRRYGKLSEIHHIFKSAPKNPPVLITLAFVVLVLIAFPILAGIVSLNFLLPCAINFY